MGLFDKLFGRSDSTTTPSSKKKRESGPSGPSETEVSDLVTGVIRFCEIADANPNANRVGFEESIKQAGWVVHLAGGLPLMQRVLQEVARRTKYGGYVSRLWTGIGGWPGPNS